MIVFEPLSASRTRLVSYGLGYRDDERYREVLEFFVPANERLYRQLVRYVEGGAAQSGP